MTDVQLSDTNSALSSPPQGHNNVGFTADEMVRASEKKKESNAKQDNPWEVSEMEQDDGTKWGGELGS